eukprot:22862-Eustigmatos_ZCMA.PRE.1
MLSLPPTDPGASLALYIYCPPRAGITHRDYVVGQAHATSGCTLGADDRLTACRRLQGVADHRRTSS